MDFSNLFENFNKYINYKDVNSDNAFTCNGKVRLDNAINYLLCTKRKTTVVEVNRFIRRDLGDLSIDIIKAGMVIECSI